MRIPDPPIDPARIAQFVEEGYWVESTSNDILEQRARDTPDKLAIVDTRVRLGYGEYHRRAERLAAHSSRLGSAPMMSSRFSCRIGASSQWQSMRRCWRFCQFHSDFRSREVEFILNFTGASALSCRRSQALRLFGHADRVAPESAALARCHGRRRGTAVWDFRSAGLPR